MGTLKSCLTESKSTVSIFFPHSLCKATKNLSFLPRTKPGFQFNSPSVTSLKYYLRNEIRDPEYRAWTGMREQDGDMAWFCSWECVERRPGSPPQVAWLNICPRPLGCLDTFSQPPHPFHHSPALFRSGDSWHGQSGRLPNLRQKVSTHC